MKSTTFALASLLAAAAVAQPHRHHHVARHGHHDHQKRDVVWVTDWDYVTETIDVTETIWVSSGFVPPTSSSKVSPSTTSNAVKSSSTSALPAQFLQGPEPSSSSTPIYVAPTPSSTYVAPPPSTPAAHVASPVVESSSTPEAVPVPPTTPVYVAPTTSQVVAAAPTPAPADTASSSSYGATTSGCKAGSHCEGDITFYTAGLGACGQTNNGSTDKVVALPHGLMGTQSNGNPYCGQTITIKCLSTGKTTTATVVDKCMGCEGHSIDLSNAAFDELADEGVGRTTAEWWFN